MPSWSHRVSIHHSSAIIKYTCTGICTYTGTHSWLLYSITVLSIYYIEISSPMVLSMETAT